MLVTLLSLVTFAASWNLYDAKVRNERFVPYYTDQQSGLLSKIQDAKNTLELLSITYQEEKNEYYSMDKKFANIYESKATKLTSLHDDKLQRLKCANVENRSMSASKLKLSPRLKVNHMPANASHQETKFSNKTTTPTTTPTARPAIITKNQTTTIPTTISTAKPAIITKNQITTPTPTSTAEPAIMRKNQTDEQCVDAVRTELGIIFRNYKKKSEDCLHESDRISARRKFQEAESKIFLARRLIESAEASHNACGCVLVFCHCSLKPEDVVQVKIAVSEAVKAVMDATDLLDSHTLEKCVERKRWEAELDTLHLKTKSCCQISSD